MALLRLTDITLAQSTAITPTTLVHIVTTGDTSQNGAGSSYKAELSQIYDGLSGYCMPQLLTSFVIPCSPLGISPNDEGNVYFGSTSGLTVDVTNNRIGIGTSTPSVKLNVKGIDNTSSNTSFLVETSGATPLFSVRNDGFASVYNASQQFGEKLSVNGTVLVGNSGYLIQDGGGGYWQMYSSGNVFGIGKSALSSPIFGIDVTNPFYIFTQSAYNFGVGISTPSAKLHVNNTTSNNTVLFEDDTNPDSTPFVIDNTGSVGIGVTTPSEKLEVSGDSLINSFILGRGNGDNINNIAFGKDALFTNTGGTRNTAIGYESLYSSLSTDGNTALGYQTLRNNIGSSNTAIGADVLPNNTTGSGNVGVGRNSLNANQTGSNNIAIDGATGSLITSQSGNQNIGIGGYSLYVQNGVSGSLAIGWASLYQNATGTGNSAVGFESLRVATGNNNTAFGYQAGTTHTTGNNNTFIGNNADSTTSAITNSTAIGYNTKTSQSNTVILGNSADVGIGTSTPTSKLQITGSDSTSSNYSLKVKNSSNVEYLSVRNDGKIEMGPTVNTKSLTIDENGNVSIGAGNGRTITLGSTSLNTVNTFYLTGANGINGANYSFLSIPGSSYNADPNRVNKLNHLKLTNNGISAYDIPAIIFEDRNLTSAVQGPANYPKSIYCEDSYITLSEGLLGVQNTETGFTNSNLYTKNLRIRSGLSTGNAGGGYITFETSPSGPTGTTQNPALERVRITNTGEMGIATSSPTAKLDISGSTGYNQLRMRTLFTPSSSGDTSGNIGDVAWDNSYYYMKTNTGWGRIAWDYGF